MAQGGVRESAQQIADEMRAAILAQERAEIEQIVDNRIEEMRDYALTLSPEDSGEYKNSFEIEKSTGPDGLPRRTLRNTDDKANLIEYGSIHNPEFAVLTKTEAHFSQRSDGPL